MIRKSKKAARALILTTALVFTLMTLVNGATLAQSGRLYEEEEADQQVGTKLRPGALGNFSKDQSLTEKAFEISEQFLEQTGPSSVPTSALLRLQEASQPFQRTTQGRRRLQTCLDSRSPQDIWYGFVKVPTTIDVASEFPDGCVASVSVANVVGNTNDVTAFVSTSVSDSTKLDVNTENPMHRDVYSLQVTVTDGGGNTVTFIQTFNIWNCDNAVYRNTASGTTYQYALFDNDVGDFSRFFSQMDDPDELAKCGPINYRMISPEGLDILDFDPLFLTNESIEDDGIRFGIFSDDTSRYDENIAVNMMARHLYASEEKLVNWEGKIKINNCISFQMQFNQMADFSVEVFEDPPVQATFDAYQGVFDDCKKPIEYHLYYLTAPDTEGPLPDWVTFNQDSLERTVTAAPDKIQYQGTHTFRIVPFMRNQDYQPVPEPHQFTITVLPPCQISQLKWTQTPDINIELYDDVQFDFAAYEQDTLTDRSCSYDLQYTVSDATSDPAQALDANFLTFTESARLFNATPELEHLGTTILEIKAEVPQSLTQPPQSPAEDQRINVIVSHCTIDKVSYTQLAKQEVPSRITSTFSFEPYVQNKAPAGECRYPMEFTATLVDGSPLPAWVTFDSATRTFTVDASQQNPQTLDFLINFNLPDSPTQPTVTDPMASHVFRMEIIPCEVDTLTYSQTAPQTISEEKSLVFTFDKYVQSNADGDNCWYEVQYTAALDDGTALPSGFIQYDESLRQFTVNPLKGDAGVYNIVLTPTIPTYAGTFTQDPASDQVIQVTVEDCVVESIDFTQLGTQSIPEETTGTFTFDDYSQVPSGCSYPFSYTAKLADGSPLPAWIAFDQATRTFTAQPTTGDAATYVIEVTPSLDGQAGALPPYDPANSHQQITLEVPPCVVDTLTWSQTTSQSIPEEQSLEFTFDEYVQSNSFGVSCTYPVQYDVKLSDGTALPSGFISFDESLRKFTVNPIKGNAGVYDIVITPSLPTYAGTFTQDPVADQVIRLTVEDCVVNSLSFTQAGPFSVKEESSDSFTFDAYQQDPAGCAYPISYAPTLADGSDLPSFISFDEATRTFTTSPDSGDHGEYTVIVTPSLDGYGGSLPPYSPASTHQEITFDVTGCVDSLLYSGSGPHTMDTGTSLAFTYSEYAMTNSEGTTCTYDITYTAQMSDGSPLPAWLVFDEATRTFQADPGTSNFGDYEIEVLATIDGYSEPYSTQPTNKLIDLTVNQAPCSIQQIEYLSISDHYTNEQENTVFAFGEYKQVNADNANDICYYDIDYQVTVYPSGEPLSSLGFVTFDEPSRIFYVSPGLGQAGYYELEIVASVQGYGGPPHTQVPAEHQVVGINVGGCQVDTLTYDPMTDQSVDEGASITSGFTEFVQATSGGLPCSYEINYVHTYPDGSNLPSFITLDEPNRSIEMSPELQDRGTYTVKVSPFLVNYTGPTPKVVPSDDPSNPKDATFDLTVTNCPVSELTYTQLSDQDVQIGETKTFEIPSYIETNTSSPPYSCGYDIQYDLVMNDGSPVPSWITVSGTTVTMTDVPDDQLGEILDFSIVATIPDLGGVKPVTNPGTDQTFSLEVTKCEVGKLTYPQPEIKSPQQIKSTNNWYVMFDAYEQVDRSDCSYEITYSVDVKDSLGNYMPMPDWLEFDSDSRTLKTVAGNTPQNADLGDYQFEIVPTLVDAPFQPTQDPGPQTFTLEIEECLVSALSPSEAIPSPQKVTMNGEPLRIPFSDFEQGECNYEIDYDVQIIDEYGNVVDAFITIDTEKGELIVSPKDENAKFGTYAIVMKGSIGDLSSPPTSNEGNVFRLDLKNDDVWLPPGATTDGVGILPEFQDDLDNFAIVSNTGLHIQGLPKLKNPELVSILIKSKPDFVEFDPKGVVFLLDSDEIPAAGIYKIDLTLISVMGDESDYTILIVVSEDGQTFMIGGDGPGTDGKGESDNGDGLKDDGSGDADSDPLQRDYQALLEELKRKKARGDFDTQLEAWITEITHFGVLKIKFNQVLDLPTQAFFNNTNQIAYRVFNSTDDEEQSDSTVTAGNQPVQEAETGATDLSEEDPEEETSAGSRRSRRLQQGGGEGRSEFNEWLYQRSFTYFNVSRFINVTLDRGSWDSADYGDLEFNYTLIHFKDDEVWLQLHFNSPLHVSIGQLYDDVHLNFTNATLFKGAQTGDMLPLEDYIVSKLIPRLLLEAGTDESSFGSVMVKVYYFVLTYSLTFFFIINLILCLFLAVSVKSMWQLMNWCQVVAFLANVDVMIPSNTLSTQLYIRDVIYWYFVPTAWLDTWLGKIEERCRSKLSESVLMELKLEHVEFGKNLGAILLLFFVILLFDVVVVICFFLLRRFELRQAEHDELEENETSGLRKKVRQCRKILEYIKIKVFFNSLLRYGVTSYLRLTSVSLGMMSLISFSSTDTAVVSLFYLFMIAAALIYPFFVFGFLQQNFYKLEDQDFKKKYLSIYLGVRTDCKVAVAYHFVFMMRRLALCMLVHFTRVDLFGAPYLMIWLLLVQTAYSVYLAHTWPRNTNYMNRLELVGEFAIFVILCHYLLFTWYVDDLLVQYRIGWSCAFFIVFVIMCHIYLLTRANILKARWNYRTKRGFMFKSWNSVNKEEKAVEEQFDDAKSVQSDAKLLTSTRNSVVDSQSPPGSPMLLTLNMTTENSSASASPTNHGKTLFVATKSKFSRTAKKQELAADLDSDFDQPDSQQQCGDVVLQNFDAQMVKTPYVSPLVSRHSSSSNVENQHIEVDSDDAELRGDGPPLPASYGLTTEDARKGGNGENFTSVIYLHANVPQSQLLAPPQSLSKAKTGHLRVQSPAKDNIHKLSSSQITSFSASKAKHVVGRSAAPDNKKSVLGSEEEIRFGTADSNKTAEAAKSHYSKAKTHYADSIVRTEVPVPSRNERGRGRSNRRGEAITKQSDNLSVDSRAITITNNLNRFKLKALDDVEEGGVYGNIWDPLTENPLSPIIRKQAKSPSTKKQTQSPRGRYKKRAVKEAPQYPPLPEIEGMADLELQMQANKNLLEKIQPSKQESKEVDPFKSTSNVPAQSMESVSLDFNVNVKQNDSPYHLYDSMKVKPRYTHADDLERQHAHMANSHQVAPVRITIDSANSNSNQTESSRISSLFNRKIAKDESGNGMLSPRSAANPFGGSSKRELKIRDTSSGPGQDDLPSNASRRRPRIEIVSALDTVTREPEGILAHRRNGRLASHQSGMHLARKLQEVEKRLRNEEIDDVYGDQGTVFKPEHLTQDLSPLRKSACQIRGNRSVSPGGVANMTAANVQGNRGQRQSDDTKSPLREAMKEKFLLQLFGPDQNKDNKRAESPTGSAIKRRELTQPRSKRQRARVETPKHESKTPQPDTLAPAMGNSFTFDGVALRDQAHRKI